MLGSGKGRGLQLLELRVAVFLSDSKFAVTLLCSFLMNFRRAGFWFEGVYEKDKTTNLQVVVALKSQGLGLFFFFPRNNFYALN